MAVAERESPLLVGEWDEVMEQVQARETAPRTVAVSLNPSEDELFRVYLENFNRFLPQLQEAKGKAVLDRWLDALLEQTVASVGLPEEIQIEARMQARARARVLNSGQFFPTATISELMGSQARNPSSLPNRLKKAGALFAISRDGEDLYPVYALDKENAYRPYPVVKEILAALKHRRGWSLANWFESPNGYLANRKPRELLATQPAEVLQAARAEAEGVRHG
jgi:hypothetical protein